MFASKSKNRVVFAKTVNRTLKYAGGALTMPEIIAELTAAISKFKKVLQVEENLEQREEIRQTIKCLEATADGAVGALAGASTGAAFGSIFGPVGTAVGTVVGATGLEIDGGIVGSAAGEHAADKGIEFIAD